MRTVFWLSLLGMAFAACGGGGTGSGSMSPGVVYLENRVTPETAPAGDTGLSDRTLVFSYFNQEHGEQIEITILPGETKNISKYELPGGAVITFTWTNQNRIFANKKLTLTIDGTVTIRVNGLLPPTNSDPLLYDVIRS